MTDRATKLPAIYEGLTDKQALFLETYFAQGGRKIGWCAIQAGYQCKDLHSASQIAGQLLRHPRILEAINRWVQTKGKSLAVLGLSQIEYLAENGTPDSVRLSAAQALMDRAGHIVAKLSQHTITVDDRRTPGQMAGEIVRGEREAFEEAAAAGIITVNQERLDEWIANRRSAYETIGAREVTDATYEMIEGEPETSSLDGLEDLCA